MSATDQNSQWDMTKSKLRRAYPHLTEKDFGSAEEHEYEKWVRIQQRVGENKEQIMKRINN